MDATCHGGYCAKCWGGVYLVGGIVVLLTAVYRLQYIWHVLGVLLILKGIFKMAKPSCPHCEAPAKGRK